MSLAVWLSRVVLLRPNGAGISVTQDATIVHALTHIQMKQCDVKKIFNSLKQKKKQKKQLKKIK